MQTLNKLVCGLLALGVMMSPSMAHSQSYPTDWKSFQSTHNPADILSSTDVADWFAKKMDLDGDVTATNVGTGPNGQIYRPLQDTLNLVSNLGLYTYGDGRFADSAYLDNYVASNCGQTVTVGPNYILPVNSDGGAHFPNTANCTNHYTWIYDSHPHTTGGTETDFRTPDDLHVNMQDGMLSLSKTKLNTDTADPHMLYLQFINQNNTVGPVASNDTTRQSLEAVELNMQAAAGSTGSLNGFQCDMTDRSTTGDNANVCAPSNVFKYSDVGKDWGISLAGYDYSATQPQNTISYTGIENDVQVSGQDMGASLWDPTQGGRHLMWLGANTVQYPAWAAGHAYSVGDKIVDANKNWVWIVTTAGTSSTGSDPTGSWQPSAGNYTDGTVVFTAKIDYHGVVSKAIYVVNDHIDSDYSYYDDVLGVNANVRDASLNLTNEVLSQSDGASIRLAKGHPIDFTGAATAASKNQVTLAARDNVTVGYEQYGTGLNVEMAGMPTASFQSDDHSLRVEGSASFGIGDKGSMSGKTQAARAGITFGHSKYGSYQTDIIYGMNGVAFTPTDTTGAIQAHPVLELPKLSYADNGTDTINLDNPVRLLQASKASLLTLSPAEGTIVNDGTDHVPVIYENGHWYPISLGAALQ